MVAAILGLVAFMLAFTFSLAASRFDAKRQTVLEEANAIGTTYLRTRLLPEPHKTEAAKLLGNYVDVRIRGVQEGNFAEAIAESEKLQELIWRQAIAAADKDHGSIMTGLFVQSLNEMIDVHAKRMLTGLRVGSHSRFGSDCSRSPPWGSAPWAIKPACRGLAARQPCSRWSSLSLECCS